MTQLSASADFLDAAERALLRQSLDFLRKKAEKVASDLRSVRLETDVTERLIADVDEIRPMVPMLSEDTVLTRAQKGCVAAALAVYLDELDKTAKSEEKIGVPTHATDTRRFEVGALAQRLGAVTSDGR